ncbi:MAG: hypothetical protein GC137_10515 [Alphaproteobacteria bacterium]|nr:hypothetical protein [Alphaproteobacteria bacterium]
MTKNTFKKWKEEDALKEWKAFADDKFEAFVKGLLADKNNLLNQELWDASLNWDSYSWPMKSMLFNRFKMYYMDIFKVDTCPIFYSLEEWNAFCEENEYETLLEDDGESYCFFIHSKKTTFFINRDGVDFEDLSFFPSLRHLAYDLATDFIYQKIYPVLDHYNPEDNNIILVHKDPEHRLKKALGKILKYTSKKDNCETSYDEYLELHNDFQRWFSHRMVVVVRELLWHMEAQYDHLKMFNMIKPKTIEIIQYCEVMADRYSLEGYALPHEEIEKLPEYQSKEEFKKHHYKYRKIIDEVTERCADIADALIEEHDDRLSKKEKYDLAEVLPFFTALFSVTRYKWRDDGKI